VRARLAAALAVLLALVLALATVSPPVGAQDETGPPETPDGAPAIDDLVGCVQSSQHLLVLFLIDESASLKQSDPDDRRVEAAQSALDSLLTLATAEGSASPQVDLALAAFSNEYRLVQDWTRAGDDTAAELTDALDGFADLEDGIDTDFVNALSAGRDALADRSASITAEGGTAPCRAVLLFTDGGFDLAVRESAADRERLGTTKPYAPGIELTSPESVQAAEAAGRRALCEPDGLADQLRADEVTLLTVALSGGVARRAQLPLAAATAGKADDYTCGTPTDRPTGAYLPAAGVDVLVARFDEIGVRLAGGSPYPGSEDVSVCGEDPCDEGSRTFTLDQGLRRAQVVALPPSAGAGLRLEGPSGESVTITEPGETTVGDVAATARSLAGRGLAVDLDRPEDAAAWDGTWTATLVDPSGEQAGDDAILQVFVFSDLGIAFGQLPALTRGATSEVTAALTAPEGLDVERLVTEASVELRVTDPVHGGTTTVAMTGPPAGPFTASLPVPDDLTSNAVEAEVVAELTTSSSAQLVARSAPSEVLVLRPEGSIQILPASLKLPSLTGTGSTDTTFILQGAEADGCVWFGELDVPSAPEGAEPIELTIDGDPLPGEDDCIEVPGSESLTVRIAASPAGRASGTVQGSFQVFERVEGAESPTTTDLSFRFDLARGVDEARRLLLVVLLVLGGLALPMVLLLVINALTARFQTLDVVRGAAVPVRVGPRGATRTDGPHARSLTLREGDFHTLTGQGTTRSFTFGGVVFRAKASRNPFGATIAMAAPEGGAEKLKGREGSRVELDPGLAGSWIFLLDAARTRRASGDAEGLLLAFVAEGDVPAQLKGLVPDIQARLPEVATGLARLVRATPAKARKAGRGADAASAPGADEAVDEVDEADAAAAVAALDDPPSADPPVIATPARPDDDQRGAAPAPDAGADEAADDPAPSAPLGFGGTTSAAPPPPTVVGDDDDGPTAPPTGFTGGGRP